ncbi:MAG: dipeptidase PepE [Planctomycetota bacterium]
MRILLGSGGFRTAERIATLQTALRAHFGGAGRLLFVPYALADHDGYVRFLTEKGLAAGYELVGIHTQPDPVRAVDEAEGIYVGGGNTFRLIDALHRLGLIDAIRARVRSGVPYFGVSAGANVACPTMMTTNDMPIVQPPSFEALGLVPFQVNAHYFTGNTHVRHADGSYEEHFGETRDERIEQLHEHIDSPVVGLWEGGLIRCENGAFHLEAAGARIFRRGLDPVDVDPPAELGPALGPLT